MCKDYRNNRTSKKLKLRELVSRGGINRSKSLNIIGNIILLLGLIAALLSNHLQGKVMGEASLGVAVLAPEKESSEWEEKVRQRTCSDISFYTGVALTAIGIILQISGTIIADKDKKIYHEN